MPKTRSYVENLTRRDVGRRITDSSDETWIIQGVEKKTDRGRRRWMVGLKHAEERRRYQELERDTILNGVWTWADDGRPHSGRQREGSRSKEVPRDDEGRRLCKRCEEPIFFVRTASGKAMPVDHEPTAARRIVEDMTITMDKPTGWVTRQGKVLTTHELKKAAQADLTVYRSHFASCNQSDG